MNKLSTIVIIVQSVLLVAVLIYSIASGGKEVSVEKVEYERIKGDIEKVIHSLKQDIQINKDETKLLIHKVDSIKEFLPRQEKNLTQIKVQLKQLNDATYISYTDSTAAAILRRLSR